MPLLNPDEYEQDPLPPPGAPPVPPGGLGPAGPTIGLPPAEAPGAPPAAAGGGGGGPNVPASLPGIPGFSAPGAPVFNYTPYRAPTMESVLSGADFQNRLNSANRQLERSAAAKGMLRSGNTLADVSELTSNFQTQAYDQELQRSLAAWDRGFQGEQAGFAPRLEQWRINANTLAGMNRDRYNADLGIFVNNNSGGGGGGGPAFDPAPYFADLLPPMPAPSAPPGGQPLPGGGPGPVNPEAFGSGDPWTDPYAY